MRWSLRWAAFLALILAVSACVHPPEGSILHPSMNGDTVDDTEPYVAADGSGTWVVVWAATGFAGADSDILVSRSTDGGDTWSKPALLRPEMASDSAHDAGPVVGHEAGSGWIAAWSTGNDLGDPSIGNDADVVVAHSSDGGKTWGSPAVMNQSMVGDTTSDFITDLTTDATGRWVACLGKQAMPGGGTWFSLSTDGGSTWLPSEYLPNYGMAPARLATDGAGTWTATWHAVYPPSSSGYYEALTSVSPDNGISWGDPPSELPRSGPITIGDATWPSVAADRAGNWVASWSVGEQVIATARSKDAVTWVGPVIVEISGNPLHPPQNHAPQVVTGGDGVWSLVWTTYGDAKLTFGADHDIMWSVSRDEGATWTDPDPLTDEMGNDTGWDHSPHSATDGNGRWVFVWTTGGHASGPSQTDTDIRVAAITVEF